MSKSIKLKNNNYWDSKGITHNRELLSSVLNRVDGLHYKDYSSNSNYYVDVDLKFDSTAEYDRRVYYYMGVTNAAFLVAGVFTYNNGNLAEHKQLSTAHTASITVNSNHTFRFTLPSNWAHLIIVSTYPM